jgi:uncharacterized damage-inducible protein DinB
MSRPLLADGFGHHVWATVRLIDVCLGLTPEQLETSVPGTYGSILDTMRHLVGSDASYLHVLSDGRLSEFDEGGLDLPALREAMERNGPEWASFVAQDLDADAMVARHRDDGTDSYVPLGVRLAQALHHGTDHRSQICTALTTLGIDPPEIDVSDFARQDGRVNVVQRSS